MIRLKSSHIYLESDLVEQVFGSIHYAFATYNVEQQKLLITPVSSNWFAKMYDDSAQFLLKDRNLKGDKTLAIRQILIDNDLDGSDRELNYELVERTKLLKIEL